MIFGDPSRFAIESDFFLQEGDWVFIHFQCWGAGRAFGDYEDQASLNGIAGWMREALTLIGHRREPELDWMTPAEVFAAAYDPHYVSAEGDPAPSADRERFPTAFHRLHITHVGMSAFSEDVAVMLIETGDGRQRLLWRRWADPVAYDVYLPAGEVEKVMSAFLAWADTLLRNTSSVVD